MVLTRPFKKQTISQRFGENATATYNNQGLKGHTGEDYDVSWGTPVPCVADGSYCYSTINKDNPDPSKYRTPCFIFEDSSGVYELTYGHASDIYAVPGKTYNVGEIVSKVGNTGDVYSNGVAVSKEARLKGSKAGAHLHLQLRKLNKVKKMSRGKEYVSDGNGLLKKDGFYYEIPDYDNGYNGCIDPEPFFQDSFPFTRDMYLGVQGEDVRAWQKYLNAHGFIVASSGPGSPGNETTYYGHLTQKATIAFQKAKKINPPAGYMGAITRSYVAQNP